VLLDTVLDHFRACDLTRLRIDPAHHGSLEFTIVPDQRARAYTSLGEWRVV
jgi:hypothetical protein